MPAHGVPPAHEESHVLGGSDPIDAALDARAIALTTHGDVVYRAAALNTLARLAPGVAGQALLTGGPAANPIYGAPAPAAHAGSHEDGGTDEVDVGGLSGLLADDQHVLDAEVLAVAAALVHAARHENGGADEISVVGLSGLLADAQNPVAHAALHQDGGADEISVAALSGLLADDQHVLDAEVLLVAAALIHAGRHENGGADEISVAGLSGLLADDQHVLDAEVLLVAAALVHAARHMDGGADELDVADLAGADGAAGEVPETDGAAVTWVEPDGRYTPAAHGAAQHTDVTRTLFIPALNDVNANATLTFAGSRSLIQLADGATGHIYFSFDVPDKFVSFTSIELVWLVGFGDDGNMRWKLDAKYAAHGENHEIHSDAPAYGETAAAAANTLYVQEPANPLAMAGLALGDNVGILMTRDGGHANDTIDAVVKIVGLHFTYTGHQ